MSDIEFSVAAGVATILLNRPAKRNAFTLDMIDEWSRFLVGARTDDDIRAIVVTGAGGAFCAGADLDDLSGRKSTTPIEHKRHLTDHIHRIAYALEDIDCPVIAAVEGPAVGAGMDFSLMCDLRIASESARFAEGYVKVGLVPGDGGCYFLPRLIGIPRALDLLWTGRFVDAAEALQMGLVNQVVSTGTAYDAALEMAKRLAAGPPIAIGMIKRATYQSARTDLRTAFNLISSDMGVVRATEDSQEAMSAFRQRRTPEFRGQ